MEGQLPGWNKNSAGHEQENCKKEKSAEKSEKGEILKTTFQVLYNNEDTEGLMNEVV